MKNLFVLIILMTMFNSCKEAIKETAETTIKSLVKMSKELLALSNSLLYKDRLLFERGYNHCDGDALNLVVSEDFEFNHDQYGITDSKSDFVNSMKGLCDLPYKARRALV